MSIEGFGSTPAELTPGVPVALQGQGAPQAPPPAVTWVAPHDAATVKGSTVGLLVSVTSTIAVTGVDFFDASNANALIGHAALGTFGWLVTWDSTGVADGARSISATATDGLGQTATVTISVTVANAAPAPPTVTFVTPPDGGTVKGSTVGLLVSVTSTLTVTSVAFSIDTGSLGNATHGAFGWLKVWDSTGVADGLHEIEVTATDANAQTTTVTRTVNVDNIPPAPGPPTITVGTPAHNATVTGTTVGLVAAAAANTPATISHVEFFVDNVTVGTASANSFGYSLTWDSTGTANGSHTIKGTVTDSTGQTASDSITVTVNNASQLAITFVAPPSGTTVTGSSVILFATATDNSPNTVSGVNFYRNNTLLGAATQSGGGWIYKWDTTATTLGTYTLTATATDSTAATASATTTVHVQNVPAPTVTFAAPARGATLAGTVTVDAIASSLVAISSVQFFLDGTLLGNGTSTAFGYTYAWDTTTATNAAHLLKAVATDALSQTGTLTISVTVNNVTPPTGTVMPVQGSGPADYIDNTDTHESTVGIRAWVAAHTSPGDTILVQPGTYWVDEKINVGGTRTFKAQDPNNKPTFHRHTFYSYRVKPDLRATINAVTNTAYNPNGRTGSWQYDLLGGQAAISSNPSSLSNPNQAGNALGAEFGGYDAFPVRSADNTQIVGLRSLYGALWSQADVNATFTYLVGSGYVGSNNFICATVASDGKSLTFATPLPRTTATEGGVEGTVTWCRTKTGGGGGWKVEHQTNDLLSFYWAINPNRTYANFADSLQRAVAAAQNPMFDFVDTTACVLDGLIIQGPNDQWTQRVVNYTKSYPVVNEGCNLIRTVSPNQIVQNCEVLYSPAMSEFGPAQLRTNHCHHNGGGMCMGSYDNKVIDGNVADYMRDNIVDVENPSGHANANVTIQNNVVGGGRAFIAENTVVNGLTVKNNSSTNAQHGAGTISQTTTLWAKHNSEGYGYVAAGTNHLIDSNHFDENQSSGTEGAMAITNVTGLTVTNNTMPSPNSGVNVFLRYGNSTTVVSTGNNAGRGAGSTTQKAP